MYLPKKAINWIISGAKYPKMGAKYPIYRPISTLCDDALGS
tara:strand:- start:303 stop:425 length:123 start_codon:yes stop_codon:yes gene_type:complete